MQRDAIIILSTLCSRVLLAIIKQRNDFVQTFDGENVAGCRKTAAAAC